MYHLILIDVTSLYFCCSICSDVKRTLNAVASRKGQPVKFEVYYILLKRNAVTQNKTLDLTSRQKYVRPSVEFKVVY